MQKNELTFDVIEVLKEVVGKLQFELFRLVRRELDGREQKLIDCIFEQYYRKDKIMGRWYDPYHILLSTRFAAKLRKVDKQVSSLIVPGIILHDIGYCILEKKEKKDWDAVQTRILHMQEGAALAAKTLTKIGYNADDIGIIVGMVATHDNVILGIPTEDPGRLALRDADQLLAMHFLSFYKDWISGTAYPKDFSLLDLFWAQAATFYSSADPLPKAWGKPTGPSKDHQLQLQRIPYTDLAKRWRDKQFKARWQEIQQGVLTDENSFRQYAEQHIQSEIAAGRG